MKEKKDFKEYDEEKLLQDNNLKKTYGFSNKYEEKVNSMYSNEELFKLAKARVSLKNSWYIHFAAYISVVFFLAIVTHGIQVPLIVGGAWGIGLFIHGVVVTLNINHKKQIAREMRHIEDESRK